jgi:hypothetical protein
MYDHSRLSESCWWWQLVVGNERSEPYFGHSNLKHGVNTGWRSSLMWQSFLWPQTWMGRKSKDTPAKMPAQTNKISNELGRRLGHQGPRQTVGNQPLCTKNGLLEKHNKSPHAGKSKQSD